MPDLNNDPEGDGLDNLPKEKREETESIIKEIEAEKKKDADTTQVDAPKVEPKPEEKKPKEEEKPKEAPKDEDKKTDEEKSRKSQTLVPAWKLKVAEDQLKKTREDLADAQKSTTKVTEKSDTPQPDDELRKKTDVIAKKYGTDPDEEYERALTARGDLKPQKVEIPKEITEGFKKIEQLENEKKVEVEELHFNTDFDSKLLPLIKAEYGDDVPKSVIEDIKDKVKSKAYSEEFAKVPLSMIYKGDDEFREVIPAKARGAEKSRGGFHEANKAQESDELDLTKEQSDDVVGSMTNDQFDIYSKNMQSKERK